MGRQQTDTRLGRLISEMEYQGLAKPDRNTRHSLEKDNNMTSQYRFEIPYTSSTTSRHKSCITSQPHIGVSVYENINAGRSGKAAGRIFSCPVAIPSPST